MEGGAHPECMEFVVLALIVLIGPLALIAGVDSRLDEKRWGDPRRL
jgi:hypothetical protein